MADSDDSDWSTDDDSDGEIEDTVFDTKAPRPIKISTPVNSAKFHPTNKIFVAGDFDGVIQAWSFDNESEVPTTELKLKGKAHDDSIRGVNFSRTGSKLFTIGNDKQLLVSDVETGKAVLSITESFEDSPYCIDSCNEFVIATGDEAGVVRLFDIRKKNPVDELLIDDGRCEDTINDIYIDSNGKYLVAASADGTLCAYNCKRKMFLHESESMGADLCSVTAIKNEKKAIVSCADGALHVYNWGEFGHPSDIFPGHDKGDLVCCKLNEKVVLTGDFKGNIRPVNIQPNRIMGILGQHQKNVPIECLDVFNEELALSVGTGSSEIRFWNTTSVEAILEGSKEAREGAKKAKKNEKLGECRKKKFFGGFENNFTDSIELKEKLHSSDEEEDDGDGNSEEKQNSDEAGPKDSDSLSESDLGPQESTTENESDAKTKSESNSDPMAHLMSAGNKRKAKNKPRKKKKMFKPLI